jgi:hypothetical protein
MGCRNKHLWVPACVFLRSAKNKVDVGAFAVSHEGRRREESCEVFSVSLRI